MLQGSGAMPTLVVEEGPVPFASGETVKAESPGRFWSLPRDAARGCCRAQRAAISAVGCVARPSEKAADPGCL